MEKSKGGNSTGILIIIVKKYVTTYRKEENVLFNDSYFIYGYMTSDVW